MHENGILHGRFRLLRHTADGRRVCVGEYPNALVSAGVNLLLQAGAGLLTDVADSVLKTAGNTGVIGGPASYGAVNNKAFMGVGAGQVATTFSGSVSAGATTGGVASASGLAAGDQVLLTDSSGAGLGSHPEVAYIGSIAGTTITWAVPPSYAHASGTKVVRMGAALDSALPSGSAYYKGIDSGFPVQGADSNGNPCLTWQATFASSAKVGVNEAAFVWNAAIIGIVPLNAAPPGAGYAVGTSTPPSNPIILAVASLVPSPLDKTAQNATYSLQYTLALRIQ